MSTPIIVVDLETTGLNMKKHEIIEIGCYNITAGQQWSTFVHPDRTKASDTTYIHGITDEEVENAPPLEQALNQLETWLGAPLEDCYVIAHNGLRFDFPWINHVYKQIRGYSPLNFDLNCIDSINIAKHAVPAGLTTTYKLEHWANIFNLAERQNHRAGDDCYLTVAAMEQFCHLIAQSSPGADTELTPRELVILSHSAPVPNLEERYARELLLTIEEVMGLETPNAGRLNDLRSEYIQKVTDLYPHLIPYYSELIPWYARQLD